MENQGKETPKKTDTPNTEKQRMENIRKRIATGVIVTVLVFEVGGAIYTQLNNKVPISAHTLQIDTLHPWGIGLDKYGNIPENIPSTFDNNAETNIVGAGINAAPATKEDMNSVGNIVSSPAQQGYFQTELIFPGLLKAGDQVKIAWKPFTIYKNTPETATLKSWYDITFGRPGTQITSGILDKDAMTIEVFKNPVYVVDNVPYFYGITIRVTRNDGSKYEVFCYEPEDVRRLKPLSILDDAPQLEEETVQVGNHTETRIININQPGKVINAGTPLMETVAKNTVIEYGTGDQGYTTKSKILVFDNVNFLTNSNNQLEYLPQP